MSDSEKTAALVGQLLAGKYYLEAVIGEGGFGAVFRALDRNTNRRYAIKVLYPGDETSISQRARDLKYFQREAGTLARVRHVNIVAVSEGGITESGLPFLVMELAEGQLLSAILHKENSLTLLRAVHLLSQLCSAVAAMHDQAIIHRDLKPENIMVMGEQPDEVVKLLDFGLAKLVRGENEEKWLRTITGRGQIHGTIFYMSPEQCEGKKLDERTDIYSLGIIAYELLAGRPPFRAASPLGIMMGHLDAAPPPLRALRADLPVEIEIAILKALEKNRNKRYQSAREFADRQTEIAVDSAVAQLKAGGNPNAQLDSPARTEVIRINEDRITRETDSMANNEDDAANQSRQTGEQPSPLTARITRLIEILNSKLKGE